MRPTIAAINTDIHTDITYSTDRIFSAKKVGKALWQSYLER